MTNEPEETTALEKVKTAALLEVTAEAIERQKAQIALLQGMVRDMLKRGIDYGRIPGTPSDSLWDPGAATIIAAFTCYSGNRRVLSFRDDSNQLSILLEVPLISRSSGAVVATGIGAASTKETKYKYRWVSQDEAIELGHSPEFLKKKTDKDTGEIRYRIPNPEHSELLNTIAKIASKRAEVDAAESLPGVASVLRQMFTGQSLLGKVPSKPVAKKEIASDQWSHFWGEVKRLGLEQDEARRILRVESIKKDWVDKGRTLEEAIQLLRDASQPTEIASVEEMAAPGEDSRLFAWSAVKGLLKDVRPKIDAVKSWFKRHGIEAEMEDFEKAVPDAKFTEEVLSRFHDALLAVKEK